MAGSSSWNMEERAWTFSEFAFLCRMMRQPNMYWEPMTTIIRPQAAVIKSKGGAQAGSEA